MRDRWRELPLVRNRPMRYGPRSLPTAVIPLFVAVAVLGYVAGHSRSSGESTQAPRSLSSAHVLIEYPAGWTPVSGGVRIPGLTIARPRLIAPRMDAAHAGLIVGSLPPGELGLSRQFVSRLGRLPDTAVVDLLEGQAYRYTQLSVPGFQATLTVFVIPNPGGGPTALACYAPSPGSPYMRACEQTVSAVTVVDQSHVYQLTPEPGYAARISASISSLDRLRVALKRELQPQITAERAQQLATRLAEGFAQAAASLSKLEPSAAVAPVQATLFSSIERARAGYTALAAAAAERDVSAYTAAKERISAAESDVDWALEDFVLLGYGPALREATRARG